MPVTLTSGPGCRTRAQGPAGASGAQGRLAGVRPGTDLPLRAVLPAVLAALDAAGTAVLVAPPGTGKTTLVPLALAGLLDEPDDGPSAGTPPVRVLVAEPRRLAARAAARRMSDLVGDQVGGLVGFTVRGESRTSARTRVEVVTTGLLVQRLLADPELAGVGVVMLDEVHERHLDTDLALAFCVDVRAALRPDLRLLATSATADAERVAAALGRDAAVDGGPGDGLPGGAAPVVEADGVLFPVEPVWCPPPAGIAPPHGLRVDPRLLDHVATVVRRALTERAGDVLVFLPGAGEIGGLTGRLAGATDPGGAPLDVVPLHGRLRGDVQDAALRPTPGRRRVVLATAVAESSVTVPGVRVVVDAGLARVPRTDLGRGLDALVTVRVSRAGATQRAGRAGREAPGAVYRCWPEGEHERLAAQPEPEVGTADLTAFALRLACWGAPRGRGLALVDAPPVAALDVAEATLHGLGALDGDGRATPRGRALARVGAHPRLARALLDGAPLVGARRAAEVVALLSDDAGTGPGGAGGDDLVARWRALRTGRDPGSQRWQDETRRLLRAVEGPAARGGAPSGPADGPSLDEAAGVVVGLAFPERLARRRRAGDRSYLMASGTAAELGDGTRLADATWLAIAVADRPPGRRDARVRAAVPVDEATAREVGAHLLEEVDEVVWAGGDVRSRRLERLGAVVLAERPLRSPDPALVAAAVAAGLRAEGLDLLRWSENALALRRRLAACRSGLGDPWPAVDDESLLAHLDLAGARSRRDLLRVDVTTALRTLAGWRLVATLDDVAPERVEVPSGSKVAVDYTDPDAPALPVKVQEVFGWTASPRVAGRPLVLRLLSPAGRPVAVTSDLESFWRNGYPGVRADLRGRYPRHPWPEDPLAAAPTRRVNPRRG